MTRFRRKSTCWWTRTMDPPVGRGEQSAHCGRRSADRARADVPNKCGTARDESYVTGVLAARSDINSRFVED